MSDVSFDCMFTVRQLFLLVKVGNKARFEKREKNKSFGMSAFCSVVTSFISLDVATL